MVIDKFHQANWQERETYHIYHVPPLRVGDNLFDMTKPPEHRSEVSWQEVARNVLDKEPGALWS